MNDSWAGLLEDKFISYSEMACVPVEDNGEPMVPLTLSHAVATHPINDDMDVYTGRTIWVRRNVSERLDAAQSFLAEIDSSARLEVVYGYRHLAIQTRSFEERLLCARAAHPDADPLQLREIAHRSIAAPEVAGHPAGAAVDIRIMGAHALWDMGTQAHDFSTLSYTHAPVISREAWAHRQMLRHVMMRAGFAPFDGEWWHFCYGDREWAAYFKRPKAIYQQIAFSAPKNEG